jgi:class 3 adenylate cyclase
MFNQYLVPQHPSQVPTTSIGRAPLEQAVSWPVGSRRWWATTLVDRIAGRGRPARRLMAVVHTDIVSYSKLFGFDNLGTVVRLKDLRRRLFEPSIRHHHGRLVQTAGDSMLITFKSISQAVRCAVTIQYALAIDNDVWPDDRRILLRVGVDLGDVIAEGWNFHGDSVIIAARLQAVCPPGGVCISRAAHDRAGERLGLPCEALGLLALKNVASPVEAFVLWPVTS